jgi:cytochrome c biogenesis protein CcdA
VIAAQNFYSLNFLRGVLATVNPCGFVLLPTYLMFFLGTQGARPGTQRANVRRALVVSASVSAGFFAVFLGIGLLVRWGFTWFRDQSDWLGLIVGIALVVFGVAMLFGFRLPTNLPRLSMGGRDTRIASMTLYGMSYAVASLGCSLPLFVPAVASVTTHGYTGAVSATLAYGAGMALTLTALTVTLATARTGLLRLLRNVMAHLDMVAAVLMLLTGVYLVWYWGSEVANPGQDKGAAVGQVESWQERVSNWLNDAGLNALLLVFGGVTIVAILFVLVRRDRASSPSE